MAVKKERTTTDLETSEESFSKLIDIISESGKLNIYRQEPTEHQMMFQMFTPDKQYSVNGVTMYRFGSGVVVGNSRPIHVTYYEQIIRKLLSTIATIREEAPKRQDKKSKDRLKLEEKKPNFNYSFYYFLGSICSAS